jgi:predicted amidohydrolase
MKIAIAAMNMGKPIKSIEHWVARVSRIALDHSEDCGVLVLPEYAAMQLLDIAPEGLKPTEEVGWLADTIEEFNLIYEMSELCDRYGIAIMAGTWPVRTDHGIVNRAHFITDEGAIHTQDKMSLTDEETDRMGWYLKPGKKVDIFEWNGVKCAIMICHDTSYSKEEEAMEAAGVQLVFMPSMCEFEGSWKTVDGHEWIFEHARKRSKDIGCWFICCGSIGEQVLAHRTEENVGGAAVYYNGSAVAEIGPYSHGHNLLAIVLKADIDL